MLSSTIDKLRNSLKRKNTPKRSKTPKYNPPIVKNPSKVKSKKRSSDFAAYNTERIIHINRVLKTKLAVKQETVEAISTIGYLSNLGLEQSRDCESVVLNRVLSIIEERIDVKPEWKKTMAVGGTKLLWIVARNIIPNFKTAEHVINDIEKKNWKDVAVGMINILNPLGENPIQCFSWLIEELKEESL